jgi:hypothetical protein
MPEFVDRPTPITFHPTRPPLRVSMAPGADAGVNQPCHGATGGVQNRGGKVLVNPLIVPVFWGAAYSTALPDGSPSGVPSENADQCVNLIVDMCKHGFFAGIEQYGVKNVFTLGPQVIVDGTTPPSVTTTDAIQTTVQGWLANNPVIPKPSDALNQFAQGIASGELPNEASTIVPDPCYILFLPPNMTVSDEPGAGGYHFFLSFQDPVPFAVIFTNSVPSGTDGAGFAGTVAPLVGHELVEMMTDPYIDAWLNATTGCEIGDLCECKDQSPTCAAGLNTVAYIGKWNLELYWSNAINGCLAAPTTPIVAPPPVVVGTPIEGIGGDSTQSSSTPIGGYQPGHIYGSPDRLKGPN